MSILVGVSKERYSVDVMGWREFRRDRTDFKRRKKSLYLDQEITDTVDNPCIPRIPNSI